MELKDFCWQNQVEQQVQCSLAWFYETYMSN